MELNSKIFIAGHKGLVGSALVRKLKSAGYSNIIGKSIYELDLSDKEAVNSFFENEKPEFVILAAAKVGGIMANNKFPADFIFQNLEIQNNVINASYKNGVKKLLFLGSSCIYPKSSPQPIKEEYLLSGPLEPTNEPYAIAKIAGIKMCQSYNRQFKTNFIACMPTNLYGPNDNFDLENSHVLPAMIRKFHEAKLRGDSNITLWGDGTAMREFLYVDDMAEACIFMMNSYNPTAQENNDGSIFMNIGSGIDITIKELAETIKRIVGFDGEIKWDITKPNGTPRKLLDISKLNGLGWRYKVDLEEGIKRSYEWYLNNN
ncbi:MAG: GDP-L-fucose synthase [Candidatus Gracilibacteria bacterium]|nr:GDP-L-fucose synthase [Candidatus Gracilibacteria bacterium]